MDYRTLEITIQYTEDLNKVNFISKMDVYVVVSISGGDESSKQKTKTAVNHGGDANPTWSFPMKFTVEEAALLQNRLMLDFKIKCERALGDRVIGEVHVPVKELLDFPAKGRGGATTAKNFISYQVKKPGGKPKGKLTFSYQFRRKSATSAQPAAAAAVEVHGESTVAYPVVDPIPSSPYLVTAAGGYSLIPLETAVVPPPQPPMEEPATPYPPPASGLYPPIVPPQPVAVSPEFGGGQYPPQPGYLPAGGMIKPEWYHPPPPPCCVFPPQGCFGHPPPVMQLAPDWWIVDWRYDARCSGF